MNPRLASPVIAAAILLHFGFTSIGSARGQQTCQPNDFSVSKVVAEFSFAADDFRPLGTTISTVTVWGTYVTWNEQGDMIDCSVGEPDEFYVWIFSESPAAPMPGPAVGFRAASVLNKIEVLPEGDWVGSPLKLWRYELQLDSPIGGLDDSGATTYWLSVENYTKNPPDDTCYWHWLNVEAAYNQHSVFGNWDLFFHNPLAMRTKDLAFCLDIEIESPPTPVAPCCDCSGCCEVSSQLTCESSGRYWRFGEAACTAGVCPAGPLPNDSCAAATPTTFETGGMVVSNRCATTDGPSPVPTEAGPIEVSADLWFSYVVPGIFGDMTIGACTGGPSGDGTMDGVLSVYHDPDNPTECVCPTGSNPNEFLWPAGQSADDNCAITPGHASGYVQGPVCGGWCFMIRLSGAADRPWSVGDAMLDATVTVASAVFPPSPADSSCVGGTSAGALCGVDDDCPGGECHSRSRFLSIGPGGDVPCIDVPDNTPSALQVRVVSAPDPNMVGDVWWAGLDQPYADVGGMTFRASRLECTSSPVVKQWVVDKPLHLYGPAVVPGAAYEVSRCATLTGPCSLPIAIQTGPWGDIVPPLGAPNFADISACVGTFSGAGNAPSRTRSKLQPALIDPSVAVSFADISSAVGAFMGQSYPFSYAQCP